MYTQHFGLTEMPFTLTPDTSFFMNRSGYQDALNVLLVALRSGEGFIKVTGEVGTGKTLLCRKLLKTLAAEYMTVYIPNPYLKPGTLFMTIAEELGIDCEPGMDQHFVLREITRALVRFHLRGKPVVICLDEVQAMPLETLETLRLLTNLETEKTKLIQVVLFAQPELDFLLESPSIRQLRQRITFAYELLPLNRTGLDSYVRHRLAVADYNGRDLFDRKAMDLLYRGSGGIPRLVNILANKAMIAAFGRGDVQIRARHVREALADTGDAREWRRHNAGHWQHLWRLVTGTAGALGMVALVYVAGAWETVLAYFR